MGLIKSIKSRRMECGLKQYELAAKAGIHPSHMCLIEQGRLIPTVRQGQKIAAALDCEPHSISLGQEVNYSEEDTQWNN